MILKANSFSGISVFGRSDRSNHWSGDRTWSCMFAGIHHSLKTGGCQSWMSFAFKDSYWSR